MHAAEYVNCRQSPPAASRVPLELAEMSTELDEMAPTLSASIAVEYLVGGSWQENRRVTSVPGPALLYSSTGRSKSDDVVKAPPVM